MFGQHVYSARLFAGLATRPLPLWRDQCLAASVSWIEVRSGSPQASKQASQPARPSELANERKRATRLHRSCGSGENESDYGQLSHIILLSPATALGPSAPPDADIARQPAIAAHPEVEERDQHPSLWRSSLTRTRVTYDRQRCRNRMRGARLMHHKRLPSGLSPVTPHFLPPIEVLLSLEMADRIAVMDEHSSQAQGVSRRNLLLGSAATAGFASAGALWGPVSAAHANAPVSAAGVITHARSYLGMTLGTMRPLTSPPGPLTRENGALGTFPGAFAVSSMDSRPGRTTSTSYPQCPVRNCK